MKIRSAANPGGFDYAGSLELLEGPRPEMAGGGILELTRDHPATEAPRMATVEHAHAWIRVLAEMKSRHAGGAATIYPGHGAAGGPCLLDHIRGCLLDLLAHSLQSDGPDSRAVA
jgi:hypothetical protein